MWGEIAAGVGGGLVNAGLGMYQNLRNEQLTRDTNAMNYQMWQKQLDYDRPVNQVARLKEAGLNPALMYGTGSGANKAPDPITAQAPRGEAPRFNLDPGVAVAIQQSRLLKEQARGVKLENDANDPAAGAPSGSRKGDSAPTRAVRDFWNELKGSGPDFIKGLKSYYNESIFGDKKHNLFFGPALKQGRKH